MVATSESDIPAPGGLMESVGGAKKSSKTNRRNVHLSLVEELSAAGSR
jgi:hypothetical protein